MDGIDQSWICVVAVPEGTPAVINGLDVWQHQWLSLDGQRATVRDPRYQQEFHFQIYNIIVGRKIVTFAAGEFSAGMWGFYVRAVS